MVQVMAFHTASHEPADALVRITSRRAQVLDLICQQHTNTEMAATLGISEQGVKRAVEELRAVTACRSKRERARWWDQHREEWRTRIAGA